MFVIRQLIKKHFEHDSDLYMLFVDYKQAFNSINRTMLLAIMNKTGIPHKLTKLVGMTMKNSNAKVKIGNKLTEIFGINTGVKQGDGLST